jgi:hypothetical protein
MKTDPQASHGAGRRAAPRATGTVVDLDRRRIERALPERVRYKYVQPRVERERNGWKIVSPNCSRNIDTAGGEIDIAWFLPEGGARWLLHARDHARGTWVLKAADLTLAQAIAIVVTDARREYWQ